MLDLFFYVFSILLQVTMTWYFLVNMSEIISGKEVNNLQKLIIFLIMIPTVILTSNLKDYFPLNTLISVIVYILCEYYIIKVKFSSTILISIMLPTVLAILEIICAYIFMFAFKLSADVIKNSSIIFTLLILSHSSLIIILIQLLKVFVNRKKIINNFFSDIGIKQIRSFLIIIIACVLPQMFLFVFNKYEYSITFLVVNSIQMIFLSAFTIAFVRRYSENEKIQRELTLSELHNKTMVNMVDGIRILKHDYNNIMQALNGYVSTKQYDKLQEHILKLISECNDINTLSVITPEIFNEPAIYGIVGAKYFIAMDRDIKFDLDITSNIAQINFSMPDLSRILGILLDNAIEATGKTDDKYIKLEMRYDLRKAADIIKVINTYDTSIDINLEDIFKKGFSTKQIRSGLGLWEVQRIINKSKNSQIYASIEHSRFVQTIVIEKS